MIDPLASTPAPVALTRPPAVRQDVTPVAPVAIPAPTGAQNAAAQDGRDPPPDASAHKQLAVDIQKADDGVFVYTLSDPDTHAVIVVIPRKEVDGSQEGQSVDKRV